MIEAWQQQKTIRVWGALLARWLLHIVTMLSCAKRESAPSKWNNVWCGARCKAPVFFPWPWRSKLRCSRFLRISWSTQDLLAFFMLSKCFPSLLCLPAFRCPQLFFCDSLHCMLNNQATISQIGPRFTLSPVRRSWACFLVDTISAFYGAACVLERIHLRGCVIRRVHTSPLSPSRTGTYTHSQMQKWSNLAGCLMRAVTACIPTSVKSRYGRGLVHILR